MPAQALRVSQSESSVVRLESIAGAAWDSRAKGLTELPMASGKSKGGGAAPESKAIHAPLPVLRLRGVLDGGDAQPPADAIAPSDDSGAEFSCPVYTDGRRGEARRLCDMALPAGAAGAAHWVLRGAAILCTTD